MRNKDFIGWVTATCKKCHKAFMHFDKYGEFNDDPPTRFYCEECVKAGNKNRKGKETPDEYLKANGITDKLVCKEFRRICKNFRGKRLRYDYVLKEAIEVAGYRRNSDE